MNEKWEVRTVAGDGADFVVGSSGGNKEARARIHRQSASRAAESSRCIPEENDDKEKGDSPQRPNQGFGDSPLFLPVLRGAVRSPFCGAADLRRRLSNGSPARNPSPEEPTPKSNLRLPGESAALSDDFVQQRRRRCRDIERVDTAPHRQTHELITERSGSLP